MKLEFNIPRPSGQFIIKQNEEILFDNTFTNYGLRQVYKSGKNVILDTANGGIFKRLWISNSSVPINKDSTGLTSPTHQATRISSTILFKTDPITNVRYAQFSTLWRLPSGISQFRQIGMSDNANGTLGLLCGRTLNGSIQLNPALTTDVTYLVQIPILSQVGTLETGTINIGGQNFNYSLEGTFHIESSTQLSTILPYETAQVITGNLSRMYVNGTILPNGKSSYKCTVITNPDSFQYQITSRINNYDPTLTIVNIYMGNSNPSGTTQADFPIRIVFTPNPTKPVGLDMIYDFSILVNFIE